jgi:hypothetical protein
MANIDADLHKDSLAADCRQMNAIKGEQRI